MPKPPIQNCHECSHWVYLEVSDDNSELSYCAKAHSPRFYKINHKRGEYRRRCEDFDLDDDTAA